MNTGEAVVDTCEAEIVEGTQGLVWKIGWNSQVLVSGI